MKKASKQNRKIIILNQYRCRECGRNFYVEEREIKMNIVMT